MRRNVFCIIFMFSLVTSATTQTMGNGAAVFQSLEDITATTYEPGKIVVKFKPHVLAKGTQRVKRTGITSLDEKMFRFSVQEVRKRFKHKPIPSNSNLPDLSMIYCLSFPTHFDPVSVAREFSRDPSIEYAEPKNIPLLTEKPNDPMFRQQTFMSIILATKAWDVQHGDSNIVIAVVDDGIDFEHPDLYDNIWTNEIEAYGIAGEDDDGNGYADDIHGYDLAEDDSYPTDATHPGTHGTFVSGIAAAVTNNGIGVAGVSWNCEIMPVKTGYDSLFWQSHFAYDGIIYAAENGADVINCSFGNLNFYSQAEQDVINYAYGLGSTIVCSGGNSGLNEFSSPAGYINALAVCWVELDDRIIYGTHGIFIDVCAPGSYLWGTNSVRDGSYGWGMGSSFAAPIVSGICGLVKSKHPDLSNDQIVRQVVLTTDNIDAKNPGLEGMLGTGRVNAYRALTETELTEVPPKIFLYDKGIDDALGGNGNGLFERGEAININVTYRNYTLGTAQNFSVAADIDDPDLTIQSGTSFLGTFHPDTILTTDPIIVSISPDAHPHMARIRLMYSADGGVFGDDTVSVIIGNMPILLVDDDDGQHNIEGYYTSVLDDLGMLYGVWDHAGQGTPSPFILSNFPIVVWACEMIFPSLDANDRGALKTYLDYGGSLFISGQDIGLDFDEGLAEGHMDFYEHYLHATYVSDNSKVHTLEGIPGDEIGDDLSFHIWQPGRMSYYQYPSEIEPGPDADAVFEYAGGEHHKGGIKYEGEHRVVYFSFGFEAIDSWAGSVPTEFSVTRAEVMRRILDWMSLLSHESLKDSENPHSSYPVEAAVTTHVSSLIGVTLSWKREDAPSFSQLAMVHQGDDVYSSAIPATGSQMTIQYFITLETPYYQWHSPQKAPNEIYSFHVGTDITAPQFPKIDQLPDTHACYGSAEVRAKVIDNLEIELVTLFYRLNDEPPNHVTMAPTGMPDEYTATITWFGSYGDIVSYYIEAIDASSNRNRATSEEKSFQIIPRFLMDDFESGTEAWDVGTGWGLGAFGIDLSTSITDSPEGEYENNEDNSLTYREIFDLSASTQAALAFWHFYDIEEGKDFVHIEASADGENWTSLETLTGSLPYPMKRHCTLLNGFCGPGNESVHIRFRLVSDASGTAEGWYLDDITMWLQVKKGDVICDNAVNVVDVIETVNVILGEESGSYVQWAADCDDDGQVNILDALGIINVILGIGECAPGALKPVVNEDVVQYCHLLKHYLSPEDFTQFMVFVKSVTQRPDQFSLFQNYPNPFNPSTDIRYGIADSRSPVYTTLKVYNILGQLVRTLVDEVQEAGDYTVTWDGRDSDDRQAASGIYFYRIEVGEFTAARRMVLLK